MPASAVVAAAFYTAHPRMGRACWWCQEPVQKGDRSAANFLKERPIMLKTYCGRQGLNAERRYSRQRSIQSSRAGCSRKAGMVGQCRLQDLFLVVRLPLRGLSQQLALLWCQRRRVRVSLRAALPPEAIARKLLIPGAPHGLIALAYRCLIAFSNFPQLDSLLGGQDLEHSRLPQGLKLSHGGLRIGQFLGPLLDQFLIWVWRLHRVG